MVETKEERHGIAIARASAVNPMHCGLEAIVGEAHEIVADVDNEGSGNWWSFDPLPVGSQDLEAAAHILPENCETLQIGVSPQTDIFAGSGQFRFVTDSRIVVEARITDFNR